jgi:hypothetical protein
LSEWDANTSEEPNTYLVVWEISSIIKKDASIELALDSGPRGKRIKNESMRSKE